jgi:hypothetical protein
VNLGRFALDLTLGPAVAMRGIAGQETESRPTEGSVPPPMVRPLQPPPEPSPGPVPRLLLGARFGFTPRSVLRTFVGFDGELGPARSANGSVLARDDSSRMPVYTVGLALGATVGTP